MKAVLLVGGTGNLGGLIGRELLKRGARLRLLVRPGSRSKVCRGAGERPGVAPVDVLARHAERQRTAGSVDE